ncbi:MAG: Ribosomal large subunit pseudouridine synthase D [Alphaproteobacteria bacterium MarineAlpha2_Bin1]|nr:MAG: Ribosomal large subunit pseudouridine synthase D [Alphaproteobacteria bacterium MarineAlpha2_Bin1]
MKKFPRTEKVKTNSKISNRRLDAFLATSLPDLSRNKIKKLIMKGNVSYNKGKITDPNHNIIDNETYEIIIPEPETSVLKPQTKNLDIFHEDEDLIVINKPAGLVVHPAPGNYENTLVNALLAHCGDSLSGIGGVIRPGIVHRLDKDTSGLLVIAKNDFTHTELSKQFKEKKIERIYFGISWGLLSNQSGEIKSFIGRNPYNRKKMAIVNSSKGKLAITEYSVSKNYGLLATEIYFKLLTGRTHQIRVHFSANKNPLIGDKIYTNSQNLHKTINQEIIDKKIINRQALHAIKLGFEHPRSKEKLVFESNLPIDINRLRDFLSIK